MTRARRTLRLALVPILAALLGTIPTAAYAERTIGLSSGSFAFEVDPGETGEGEVVVTNDGDEPLKALVYVTDVIVDDIGGQTFEEPVREGAALLSTPASWFQVFMPEDSKSVGNTPYLEMDPGDRVPIRFAFSPPAGTPSGDHNIVIFFEMFEFDQGGEGAVAQVAGRLGARVAVRVTGEVIERLTIRPFDVPGFRIGNLVPFTFTVNNAGNTNKRVSVPADLLDRSEHSVVASVVASDTAIFADSRYRFEGALDTGAGRFGPHTLEVRLQYFLEGAQSPSELVEQRTVWLVPTWAVLLLLFLVFDGLVYGAVKAWRQRDRQSKRVSPEPAPASREILRDADAESADGAAGTARLSAPTAPPREREQASHESPTALPREASHGSASQPRERHGRRLTRKELRLEAEERRRRREERAAEASGSGERRSRSYGDDVVRDVGDDET